MNKQQQRCWDAGLVLPTPFPKQLPDGTDPRRANRAPSQPRGHPQLCKHPVGWEDAGGVTWHGGAWAHLAPEHLAGVKSACEAQERCSPTA